MRLDFLMSARHREMLKRLADARQVSLGAMIRLLIERAYELETLRETTGRARATGSASGRAS